ncbi:MAG: HAMP domain-containing sensor histidine kinase [Vicinamibacterales bacterium]
MRTVETPLVRDRQVHWRRLLAAGVLLAATVGIAGAGLEWARFGRGPAGALAKADADVRRDFDRKTALLARLASAIATDPATARALEAARSLQGTADADAARALFEIIDIRTGEIRERSDIALTIFDLPHGGARARAWAGRPSDIPDERIRSPLSWFVTPSAQGLRLVHLVPVATGDGPPLAVVVAEQALSAAPAAGALSIDDYTLPTAFGPASVRFQYEGAGEQERRNAFLLRAPSGEVLLEATLPAAQIARARSVLRRRVVAAVLGTLAVTLLLLAGPLLDRRSRRGSSAAYPRLTAAAALLVVAGAALGWAALDIAIDGSPGYPVLLLIAGGATAALIALLAAPLSRRRAQLRGRRRTSEGARTHFAVRQLLAGIVVAALVSLFALILRRALAVAPVDLRDFSLHPWSVARLTLLAAILACHLAALWAGTLVLAASIMRWRFPRRDVRTAGLAWLLWTLPAAAVAAAAVARGWDLPALGIALSAAVCATAALAARDVARWFRHATVAARIMALFVAFLVPSLLLYPSVNFLTTRALRSVIATRYAVEAQQHPEILQARLEDVRHQIDAMPSLPGLVQAGRDPAAEGPGTGPAFFVWRQTALASARLTSAVELYGLDGGLVSRFALNFPEYTGTIQPPGTADSCEWEVFGEAAPFGSEERRFLHAQKNICNGDGSARRVVGSIVVHVGLDYRTLPFITSQSPYFEVFRTEGGAPAEGMTGSGVDLVIYGWGLTPLYASGTAAWPITNLFPRIYGSREPFWTEIERGNVRWHVFFSNNRNGIYALGYPALTLFDRFVHLAELTTLAGAAFVLVLMGTAFFTRVARERPRVGRALLREIRASFYRKLFLAFVLASIIPVLTLALVIRTYFAGLLRADVEAEAARSASVAQRVIEETQALPRPAGEPPPPASDDVLIWISQVIDQDVNIFAGPDLLSTSERDLFASGLLPTRTPADVYRAIVLQRLPSFVGEDRIATLPYMIAAAPIRAGSREAILTVPLADQQREIEREVDEIDRGVHLAVLFFILVGAAMGLSMAERIADPVRRLTRATRRIASGDFDARIAVRSADELRRLVDAFNSMAGELKAQRTQLERTHRLEAWAEMARQVAHEIKNPLTPIQLSAEHLRRVHADRGEPMGPVLDSCVTSILGQVRLLRQISSEFSNFASSPVARPAAVDLPELVAEVVDPYRTGLAGRVALDNRVAPPLPPVFVDRVLIGRALVNIVENALHAMPSRGAITLTAAEGPEGVVLRVRDTGVGMDDEARARVFEPYFSTKATGTGLGLPIARRNVELSGGRIDVESARGEGTTVVLTLPKAMLNAE